MCFNRTFMELKLSKNLCTILGLHSFNRTFMELKYPNKRRKILRHSVLIVPLWN